MTTPTDLTIGDVRALAELYTRAEDVFHGARDAGKFLKDLDDLVDAYPSNHRFRELRDLMHRQYALRPVVTLKEELKLPLVARPTLRNAS